MNDTTREQELNFVPRAVKRSALMRGCMIGLGIGVFLGPILVFFLIAAPALLSGTASAVGGELNQKQGIPLRHFERNFQRGLFYGGPASSAERNETLWLGSIGAILIAFGCCAIGGKMNQKWKSEEWTATQRGDFLASDETLQRLRRILGPDECDRWFEQQQSSSRNEVRRLAEDKISKFKSEAKARGWEVPT
jgi:hypothetical protein